MTSSYEQRIVQAMLRHAQASATGDENTMATALVEAMASARALRREREGAIRDETETHEPPIATTANDDSDKERS